MTPLFLTRQRRGRAALLAPVALLLALAACGGGNGDNATSGGGPTRLAAASAVAANAQVVSISKVGETRVGRTVYDYAFQVTVKNGPLAQRNLIATLVGAGPGTTIIGPSAHLGDLAPDQTATSTDTVVLRQDRTRPFDPAALVWSFGGETVAQAVARLEAAGAIPALERGGALPGPDQNGNRIRDDIDAFIARQNFAAPLRLAAEQLARGFQAAVALDAADPALAQPIAAQIHKGMACVYRRFPKVNAGGAMTAHQLVRNLQKLTANTEPRVLSYMKYNASLNGTVATLPRGDTCEN